MPPEAPFLRQPAKIVIPAKTGMHFATGALPAHRCRNGARNSSFRAAAPWIPAFAGMTLISAVALLTNPPAFAGESTSEAMKKFGLIGTWSPDCAKEPGKAPKAERVTYSLPDTGSPKVHVLSTLGKVYVSSNHEIRSAVRVTENKLNLTVELLGSTTDGHPVHYAPLTYQAREVLILRTPGGIRVMDDISPDRTLINVRDGEYYRISGGSISNPVFTSTGVQTETLERCLN